MLGAHRCHEMHGALESKMWVTPAAVTSKDLSLPHISHGTTSLIGCLHIGSGSGSGCGSRGTGRTGSGTTGWDSGSGTSGRARAVGRITLPSADEPRDRAKWGVKA